MCITPRLLPLGFLALAGTLAAAQSPPALEDVASLRRPKLNAQADTNSWVAYYDYGVAQLRVNRRLAAAAFAWSSRLDPSRAEPLFARWVVYWASNPGWFQDYLQDRPQVVNSPQVLKVDSLYWRAVLRNPFVPRHLALVMYDDLPGEWSTDPFTQALLAYDGERYADAVRGFSGLVRRDPVKYNYVRFHLALCFTAQRQFDSAAAEVSALLAEMRRRNEARFSRFYDSQELYEYSLALLQLAHGDVPAGRASLGRSLQENLGFYPAHAELGELALADRDTAQALAEYGQAAELGPEDGIMRFHYGVTLLGVHRLDEAEGELRRAIELEPLYAPPYLALASLLEERGASQEALAQYQAFVTRAARDDELLGRVRARIAALSGPAVSTPRP
jgi:tetratricopeptide (TPR) repeat protein